MEERAKTWDAVVDHPRDLMEMEEGKLRTRSGGRRWRLFSCACAWRVASLTAWPRTQLTLETVERYADGAASWAELDGVARANLEGFDPRAATVESLARRAVMAVVYRSSSEHAFDLIDYQTDDAAGASGDEVSENVVQVALFKDIFGNPFRPVPFDPSWRTPTVAALAAAIYADRAWDRMPILADALEEAGCADARVLDHCRSYPAHARGCWVVDAVLGKS